MPGPPPKPAHLRQRRNKPINEATLLSAEASAGNEVPELPARDLDHEEKPQVWHPKVLEWWSSIWRSPMSSEFLDADMKGGLYLLADLHQQRWEARDDGKTLTALAAEIRLQEVRFGLSPIDRSRLRWTIEQGETARERTEARREGKAPPKVPKGKDPRSVLKLTG